MLVVGERLSRSRYITNLCCFSGTWHIFSSVFFPLHFFGFAPSKQNILNHSHSLLAQQIHYIFKRPFPTYRWAWNRWVITWPVTSLPYCYLLTSDSFGKPHACSQHGLLSRWIVLETSSGAWGFANTEKERVCSPLGLSVYSSGLDASKFRIILFWHL